MCRLCDKIGPICGWRARKSLEAYFAEWPCSDCEPEEDETTSDGSDTCLLGQPVTDACPGVRPPQSPTEAVPRAAPVRLVVLRPGTVAPVERLARKSRYLSLHRADRRARTALHTDEPPAVSAPRAAEKRWFPPSGQPTNDAETLFIALALTVAASSVADLNAYVASVLKQGRGCARAP
jgi:hypothetical protein